MINFFPTIKAVSNLPLRIRHPEEVPWIFYVALFFVVLLIGTGLNDFFEKR